jgi:hypothetical protein
MNEESNNSAIGNRQSAISLRRFVSPRAVVERCDLCSAELGNNHSHLIEPETRKLVCACDPCAILFSNAAETKYRRVPQRIRYLPQLKLADAQWESLMIPINMAFFFHNSVKDRITAMYPSPAGAAESLLDLEAWETIVAENPVLQEMEPDTEALLVNRIGNTTECFLLPIDECFKLVGIIRANWKGFSGGTEVWEEIADFFAKLNERATVVGIAAHA